MSADIDALYKNAKAVLWVEDPETKAWLNAVWAGLAPTILVLVAGNRTNVDAVCKQAAEAGHTHVFGLVDQDFGTSNRAKWQTLPPVERVYRLDVHEVENLLIDPAALSGCGLNTGRRAVADIDARLLASVQTRDWWLACCSFLATTHKAAVKGYPSVRNIVASLADAHAYVCGSTWFATTAGTCPQLADPAAVSSGLQVEHARVGAALSSGTWRTVFPGKQLFQDISTYVYHNGKGTAARLDLVKAVGAWQLQNGVPSQATDLRSAIFGRIPP